MGWEGGDSGDIIIGGVGWEGERVGIDKGGVGGGENGDL